MKTLYVVSLFPCWSETFIVREIGHLLRRGVDVQILSMKQASETLVQADAAEMIPRVLYPSAGIRGHAISIGEFLRKPLSSLSELRRILTRLKSPEALLKTLVVWWRTLGLLPAIRALRPDHIHAHWATYPSTAAMLISERLGVRFSFTCHAHDIFVNDHLLEAKLKEASFAVTISEFNRGWLMEKYPADAGKRLEVIHCGLPLAEYRRHAGQRERGLLVAVGRLDGIKGFAHLIDACAELKRRGVTFACRIVGSGPLLKELEAQIGRRGVGEQCSLLGALPQLEVRRLVERAEVFVLPSVVVSSGDRDGIPVALMEAMAVGTPVVSTRVSGIPELVEDEVSGFLAEPGDAQALADQIQRILGDSVLAASLAERARGRIEYGFDVAREAERLLELMKRGAAQ